MRLGRTQPLYVLSFEAFVTGDNVECDILTFIERLESGSYDGCVVYEYILAGILSYETKTFFVVEPLNFATSHTVFFSWVCLLGWLKNETDALSLQCAR